MPHIAIGMLPGRSLEQKKIIARKLREMLACELDIEKVFVSVSIEDVKFENWDEFMERIPDDAIIIPEEKYDDGKYKKGSCPCC
ncbi:MAG: tautomerase family protein [Oscillospiraceae bacterium]|nr:tautomerase family protein [Oscillospiraceae bacterium]